MTLWQRLRRHWTALLPPLVLLLLLAVLTADPPPAPQAPRAAGKPPALDISLVTDQATLTQNMAVLIDPGGALRLPQVLDAPGWRAATPANLNRGYTTDTLWLRGSFINRSPQPQMRWLAIGSIRLEHIHFTVFTPDESQPLLTTVSGAAHPAPRRPQANVAYLFPVTLAPGERIDYLLQIGSRSIVSVLPRLWDPAAYRESEGEESQAQALLLGPMLLALCYALYHGLRNRDHEFLVLAACIGINIVYNLQFYGLLYRYFPHGGEWLLRITAPLTALNTAGCALMTLALLRLDLNPFWRWAYRLPLALFILTSVYCALGDYSQAALRSRDVMALFDLVCIASIADVLRRRQTDLLWPALAMLLIWLILLSRLLTVYHLLPDLRLIASSLNWISNGAFFLALNFVTMRRLREWRDVRGRADLALQNARALEQAVRARTAELQAALIAADEASQAKNDFLARVSHDLRTPLTSIIGFADQVQIGGREDAERGRIIRRSASHMLSMINDLIDYARGADPDLLHPAPHYSQALFDAIAQEGAALARKHGNRFFYHPAQGLPPLLELDAKRVRQVLGNLIDNAAKFTSNGMVELSLSCRPRGPVAPNSPVQLLIRVRDNGCGIALADQQRMFEPFQRLGSAQPGLGLGLAIVRNWVERMGGRLDVDSAPGSGTTMSLTLNSRYALESELGYHALDDGAGQLPQFDGGGRHIWIAEDAGDIRALLVDELSQMGFTVTAARDGLELIALIDQMAAPALVLTDYLMPNADGRAVLLAARARLPGVPVLLLSATMELQDKEDDAEASFDARLLKPINLAQLRITLARLLQLDDVNLPMPLPESAPRPFSKPLHRPPARQLESMSELVSMGAVSDLIDWAGELARRQPEFADFAKQVEQRARNGDLSALRVLAA